MNQILYLALVQKHTSVQLDGSLQLVLCICTFFIFFFYAHVCHLKTHVSEYSSEYMYYQNFRVLRGKKIKEIHVFPQALFFSTNFAIFAVVSSTKFVPGGRVKSKPTRANKSHVRLLAIDWLEKANKKHTSKT